MHLFTFFYQKICCIADICQLGWKLLDFLVKEMGFEEPYWNKNKFFVSFYSFDKLFPRDFQIES